MTRAKHYSILLIISVFSYCLGILSGINKEKMVNKKDIVSDNVYFKMEGLKDDTLSLKNLYKEILNNEIKHPEIVLKQAILETGNLKSNVLRQNNNMFGFYNGKRYLKFDNWRECVKFYKKWQDKRYLAGNYYSFLANLPYAEDTLYVKKLMKIRTPSFNING